MKHTQCRYHLHADGTVVAPFEWFGSVRGQTVYVPQGHPSGMGGMSIYINAQGRFALPRSGRVLAEARRKSTESSQPASAAPASSASSAYCPPTVYRRWQRMLWRVVQLAQKVFRNA